MELSEINFIHVINDHLEQFYDLTNDSLVKYSDHTVEWMLLDCKMVGQEYSTMMWDGKTMDRNTIQWYRW